MSVNPQAAYEGRDPYVFVSYSHEDREHVYSEIAGLQDQGVNVWYDVSGIDAGSEWSNALAAAIKGAAHFVYFITPRSVASEYCRRELNFALEEGCPVIAVHLEKTEVPDGMRLSLNNRQALFRYADGNYLQSLLRAIRQDGDTAAPNLMGSAAASKIQSDAPSFFVLPVSVIGGDEQLRELASLMSEHLLDCYVLFGVRVTSGSFTESEEQAFEAARASNMHYVVSTSLRPLGNNVSVRAQLATASGERLATNRWLASRDGFERRIEQFANRTLEVLVALYGHEFARSKDLPVESLGVWGLVSRSAIQMINTYWPNSKTMEMLHRAVALDPDHAPAHVWLAIALYRRMEGQVSKDVVKDREDALLHADEAVRLNPYDSGLSIAALLHSSFGDASLASAFVSRYEASYGTSRSLGILHAMINLGRAQQVVDLLQDDPSPEEDLALGKALQQIGDFEAALIVEKRYLALTPNFAGAWVELANTLGHLNRREEALSAWESAKKLSSLQLTLEFYEKIGWMYPGQDEGKYGGLRRLGLD